MNDHNEKKEYINIGKRKIDISNIPYGKIAISMDLWNEKCREREQEIAQYLEDNENEKQSKLEKDLGDIKARQVVEFQSLSDSIGLELIRQPLTVLCRRYFFIKAFFCFIGRYLITQKTISRLNKKQYEEFDEWVYFTMTGKKKEDLLRQKGLLDLLTEMEIELESKTNLNLEQCLTLLQTSLGGIVEQLTHSTPDLKA
ncbi:MAG: hypothetical protein GY928_08230 [Colwellia sp.]|nr:hypothetical protein [Colwellia sp.]